MVGVACRQDLAGNLATSANAPMVTLDSFAPKLELLRPAIQTLARIMDIASRITENIGVTGFAGALEGIRESIALIRLVNVIQILAKMGGSVRVIIMDTSVTVTVIQAGIVPYCFVPAIQIHVRMVDVAEEMMMVRPTVCAIQVTQECTVNTRLLPATQIHANLVDVAWYFGELDSTIAIAS